MLAADQCWVTANGAHFWLTEYFLYSGSCISVLLPTKYLWYWSGINQTYACLPRGMLESAGGSTAMYQLAQTDIILPSLMALSTTDREFSIWIVLGRKWNTNPLNHNASVGWPGTQLGPGRLQRNKRNQISQLWAVMSDLHLWRQNSIKNGQYMKCK